MFKNGLTGLGPFDMSKEADGSGVTGPELLEIFKNNPIRCQVCLYYPKWPWSRVYGYYNGGKNVYLNARKLGRGGDSIANTIAHEYTHLVDNFVHSAYIGHGDNSPTGKEGTAPWVVGSIAARCYRASLEGIQIL